MSVTENEVTAAIVIEEDDHGEYQPCDAQSEASAVPATAEVCKGVASLPSPNKTGVGRQQVMYSILEETPPWTRQSFMDSMFSMSSFQEDLGASPASTARLTPGLRRLCLEASPSLARSRTESHGHVHQATYPSLENETPPWMKASFMDYSITTPTDQANAAELSSSADVVVTVPLPDVVKLNSQNDTMDVESENRSPSNAPPNGISPSVQNEVNSLHKSSPVSANTERPAADINNTMDLPGGSTAGAASDVTVPVDEMNTTTNLTSGCSSPNVVVVVVDGINPSTSISDLNRTTDVENNNDNINNNAPSIVSTSNINASTGDGNETVEMMHTVSPNVTQPDDASVEVPDASMSNHPMNGTMELAGCAGSTTVATPTERKNLTMEMGKDCSMAGPECSPNIPTPASQLSNTTVNQEDDSKSTTAEVNTTMPVNHKTTMDFSNGAAGTDRLSVAAHNGTVDLVLSAATPVLAKQSREMNATVDLVCSGNTPVTVTSVGRMNSTIDLQSTTISASPSIATGVQKSSDPAVPGVISTAAAVNSTVNLTCIDSPRVTGLQAVINGTVNLTSIESPCVPSTAVANGTVNLTCNDSPRVTAPAVINGTVNLTSIESPCVPSAAVANGTVNLTSSVTPRVSPRLAKASDAVNLTCTGSPSVSGVQKMDNTVEIEASNRSSSPEAGAADGQRDERIDARERTSPSSDTNASAAQQGTGGSVPPGAANGTVSDSATLTLNLNLSEAEVTVERSAPESRLSAQFMLDDSLDLQACSLVTSTPMPEHREFSFSRPADVFLSRACEARKQLVLPANSNNTITMTTNANAPSSSSPTANGGRDSDPPGEDGAGASSTESSSPTEVKVDAQASLPQGRAVMPKPTSIALPKAAALGAKTSGLPVTRRTIPKPTRRTGLLGVTTLANSTVEAMPAPSGIPGAPNRLSLGMKAALRSAASAGPAPPAPALQKRLSLAPPMAARLKKKTNEGAIPPASKEAAASSARPTRVSTGIKRPVPEPKGGPAKRSKDESTQASVTKDSAASAGRPTRSSTGLRKALPEPNKRELRRPAVGPASKLRTGLLMTKGPALPTVPEDAISTSSNHTITGPAGSSVIAPSLDSEGTYLCEGEGRPERKPDCKNCEFLQQQNEELHKEIEALKAQLLKAQNP